MARSKTRVKLDSKKIYSWMFKKNLKSTELAFKADVGFSTLCRALDGKSTTSFKTVYKIAEALGVDCDYLIDKNDCELFKAENLSADKNLSAKEKALAVKEEDLAAKEKALAAKKRQLAKLEKDLTWWQNFLLEKDRLLLDKKKELDANATDVEAKAKIFDAILKTITKFDAGF